MDEVEDKGHQIVSSELDVSGRAEGIDEAGFESAARAADERLPLLHAHQGERIG